MQIHRYFKPQRNNPNPNTNPTGWKPATWPIPNSRSQQPGSSQGHPGHPDPAPTGTPRPPRQVRPNELIAKAHPKPRPNPWPAPKSGGRPSYVRDAAEDLRDSGAWCFAKNIFAPDANEKTLRLVAASLCAAQAALDAVDGMPECVERYEAAIFESLAGGFDVAMEILDLYAHSAGLREDRDQDDDDLDLDDDDLDDDDLDDDDLDDEDDEDDE